MHNGTELLCLRGGPPTEVMCLALRPGPNPGDLLFIGTGVETEFDREIRIVTNWFEELRRLVPVR